MMRDIKVKNKLKAYLPAILLLAALIIKVVSLQGFWIEHYYSTGIYLGISAFFRLVFGWLPFSLGDILYTTAGIYLVWRLFLLVKALISRRFNTRSFLKSAVRTLMIAASIYICFNVF